MNTALQIVKALSFTVWQAFLSMLIALGVGLWASYYTAKKKSLFARFLSSLSAVPLCVPPLLVALGFVLFYGMNGNANRFLMSVFSLKESPLSFLYSFTGIIVAHGFYNFPLVMRTCSDIWASLPEEEEEAAALLGSSKWRIFRTITLYQISSALASSGILVFLYCFFSFIIVLLFGSVGGTTIEVEVYRAARITMDYRYAGTLAIIETLTALSIVYVYSLIEGKGMKSSGSRGMSRIKTPIRTVKEKIPALVLFSVIFLFFLAPFFSIPVKALLSQSSFSSLFSRKGFYTALYTTLGTSVATASLSVLIGLIFTLICRLIDPYKQSRLLRIIPLIPIAVSSIVLGFVLILILHALNIKAGLTVLVFAQTMLIWPFAYRQIVPHMDRIPLCIDEAASVLSERFFPRVFRVYIPLCRRGLLSAFAFCFAISAGDASLPLVLAIPRSETLALFTYRLAGSYRFAEACACGTILMIISMMVFFLGDKAADSRYIGEKNEL